MNVIQFPTKSHKRKEAIERKKRESEERKKKLQETLKKHAEEIDKMRNAPRWNEKDKHYFIHKILELTSFKIIPKVFWDDEHPPTTLCTVAEVYSKIKGTAINCIELSTDNIIEKIIHIHGVLKADTYDTRIKKIFKDGCAHCAGINEIYKINNNKWEFSQGGSHTRVYAIGTRCKKCQISKDFDTISKDLLNENDHNKLEAIIKFIKDYENK